MKKADYLLQVENLKVFFESQNGFVRAVDNVSFNLKSNSVLSIIGESGSGKTVLLSAICGILKGDPGIVDGKIKFKTNDLLDELKSCVKINEEKNRDVIRKDEYRYFKMLKKIRSIIKSEISMIFQDPRNSLDPLFTIEEQLLEAFNLKLGKTTTKSKIDTEIKDKMIEWLLKVNILNPQKVLKQFPNELSGGMLQRVMIAISMIIEPSIIIADEPTTALDISTTVIIIDLLQEIFESGNTSIIFVTHDISLAEKLSNEIIVMNSGQIVENGNRSNVFNNHFKHPYTNELFKSKLLPLKTNINTPMYNTKDRSPEEIYLRSGCKFRQRCEKADTECSVKNMNMRVSENHWIFCKNIYEKVLNA